MCIFRLLLLALSPFLSTAQQDSSQTPLNKAGPMVRFEVLIAELAEPAAEPTAANVLELEKTGKLRSLIRLQLAAVEQQAASVQIGQLIQRVSGQVAVAGRRGGPGLPAPASIPRYSDVNVGTTIQVTPRIEKDGSIAAQL